MMCKTNKKYKTKKLRKYFVRLVVGEIAKVWNWGYMRDRNTYLISINYARIIYYLSIVWKYLLFEKVTINSE